MREAQNLEIWNMEKYDGNMKKFFQVPGPRGKLGIFLCPGNMKECEEICGKYENKDSPYIWAVGLGKISRSSS